MTDNEKRWLVFGIALHKIVIPQIRPFVDQEVNKEYNECKTSRKIHLQNATNLLERWHRWPLRYENINGNNGRHYGGRYDYAKFDYLVRTHTDFAKLYLERYMVHFNAFDDQLEASAVLLLLCVVPVFQGAVAVAAESVRKKRNNWAHPVFSEWNERKFQESFVEVEHLVKAMALPSSDKEKVFGELKYWQNIGDCFLHNAV